MAPTARSVLAAALLALATPTSKAQCATDTEGTVLNNCWIPRVRIGDGETIDLAFDVAQMRLPFVMESGGEIIGSFVMHGKGFGVNGGDILAPSPTLVMPKGGKTGIRVRNALKPSLPGDYVTNIHTHGLHVSSEEDDVTIHILPNETYLYKYTLPFDHAGGTHWYHPHSHPLSVLFSSSGAAGMLIIEDADDGTEIPKEILELPEMDLVFNYFSPAQLWDFHDGADPGSVIVGPDPKDSLLNVREWTFNLTFDNPKMGVEIALDQLKINYILVNGFYHPRLELEQGRWYRWRMLLVSPVYDISMALYDLVESNKAKCKVRLLSRDGVYLKDGPRNINFATGTRIHLHPANRADVLIRCDGDPGSVAELYDNFDEFSDFGLVNNFDKPADKEKKELLFRIHVVAKITPGTELEENFDFNPCLPVYLADLLNADVKPFGNIPNADREGFRKDGVIRESYFSTDFWTDSDLTMKISVTPFSLDGVRFPGWIDARQTNKTSERNITIIYTGEIQQFQLTDDSLNHPLHIHVNHFQLQEDINDGRNFHKRGDWVDTIRPRDQIPVTFRFRTDIFTGRVPLHCHNMVHSDTGAMGQFWIKENPRPIDPIYSNMIRPWNSHCNTVIEAYFPTPFPTRSPTEFVPNAPSASPTFPAPTIAPTSTSINIKTDVTPYRMFPNEGVIVTPVIQRFSPFEEIEYCWVRKTQEDLGDIESLTLGYDHSDCSRDDEPARSSVLEKVYPLGRRQKELVIMPWMLTGKIEYTYVLQVKQLSSEDKSDFFVWSYEGPNTGSITVTPNSGFAGITEFDIEVKTNQTGLDNLGPFKYRFAIQMNTLKEEVISISSDLDTPRLTGVYLPLADDQEVSFISVVAFVVDNRGALSKLASPDFVRVRRPSQEVDLSSLQDLSNPDTVLRSALAFASTLQDQSTSESRNAQKRSILDSVKNVFELLKKEPLTFQRTELITLAIRNAALTMVETDTAAAIELLDMIIEVIDAVSELVRVELADQLEKRGYTNQAFLVTPGLPQLMYDVFATALRTGCKAKHSDLLQNELRTLFNFTAQVNVPGVNQFTLKDRSSDIQTVLRYDMINTLGGDYEFDNSRRVTFSKALFVKGTRALYDAAWVATTVIPHSSFCGLSSSNINGTAADSNSTLTTADAGLDSSPFLVERSQSPANIFFGHGRTLQQSDEPYQVLVSDVYIVDFSRRSSDVVTPEMNASFRILPVVVGNGREISNVQCGFYDTETSSWLSNNCRPTVANQQTSIEYLVEQGTLQCTCTGVTGRDVFGAFVVVKKAAVVIQPVNPDNMVWLQILGDCLIVFLPVGLTWFLVSMWGFGTDKQDAERVKSGALLAFLAEKERQHAPRKVTARIAFKTFFLRSLRFATVEQDMMGVRPVKPRSGILSHLEKSHSIIGLYFFDAVVSRMQKSFALLCGMLAALAMIFFFQHVVKLDYITSVAVSAVYVGIVSFGCMTTFRWAAKIQKRDFSMVAHVQRKAREFGRKEVETLIKEKEERDQREPSGRRSQETQSASLTPEDVSNQDEDDLCKQQLAVIRHSLHLKVLQRQHDRLKSSSERFWMYIRSYMWFLNQKPEFAYLNRIYGGKVTVSSQYREARLRLSKTEGEFDLTPPVLNQGNIVQWSVVAVLVTLHVVAIVFAAIDGFALDFWVVDSLIALAAGMLVVEPILCVILYFLPKRWKPYAKPTLTKERPRYYSWDSRMSTRSLAAVRRHTEDDLERGNSRGGDRRGSTYSTATTKTAIFYRANEVDADSDIKSDEDSDLNLSDIEESARVSLNKGSSRLSKFRMNRRQSSFK